MNQVGRCSKCSDTVYFLTNETTGLTGIINAATVDHGNIAIDRTHGTYRVVPAGQGDYISHFVTCPYAKDFARKPQHKEPPR